MPKLIKGDQLIDNEWELVSADANIDDVLSSNANRLLVPVLLFLDHTERLADLDSEVGVWIDSEQNLSILPEWINSFPVIALNFPSFKDGRAYSYAAIIRQQLGYNGELMAIGDVHRDQLSYMLSCGFSSFLVSDDSNHEVMLNGLHDFSENYQSTVLNPIPLFRRRSS